MPPVPSFNLDGLLPPYLGATPGDMPALMSPYAVTVGALDTKGTAERGDDVVAAFSSSGPTQFDLVLKPDLVAPGRRVTSS